MEVPLEPLHQLHQFTYRWQYEIVSVRFYLIYFILVLTTVLIVDHTGIGWSSLLCWSDVSTGVEVLRICRRL